MESPVLFYDGYCALCNFWVKFLYTKPTKQFIYFATLESEALANLRRSGVEIPSVDSALYWDGQSLYTKADVAIQLLRQCKGGWRLLGKFISLFPPFLRNFGYDGIAAIRYKVFGKYESCPIPPPEVQKHFLK